MGNHSIVKAISDSGVFFYLSSRSGLSAGAVFGGTSAATGLVEFGAPDRQPHQRLPSDTSVGVLEENCIGSSSGALKDHTALRSRDPGSNQCQRCCPRSKTFETQLVRLSKLLETNHNLAPNPRLVSVCRP